MSRFRSNSPRIELRENKKKEKKRREEMRGGSWVQSVFGGGKPGKIARAAKQKRV